MTAEKLDVRHEILNRFATEFELPPIDGITQHGEDPATAIYSFHFVGGPSVKIGTIETLWSRSKTSKVLVVAMRQPIRAGKPSDWTDCIGLLAQHVIEVTQADDERFEETVIDWLRDYLRAHKAGTREERAPEGMPFLEDGDIWIKLPKFLSWITREYHQRPTQTDVLRALKEHGYSRRHVAYNAPSGRTSTSYYHGPMPDTQDYTEATQQKAR